MSHVRKTKYVLLLVCLWSAVFPQFGTHSLPPVDSIATVIARYDVNVERSNMAMPCPSVGLRSPDKVKRTIRFVDILPEDIEEVVVATPFKDYIYAIQEIKTVSPKPIVRNPSDVNIVDVVSYAVARYRAIELANGKGLVSDTCDTEFWRGVPDIDPNGCRKLPVIWTDRTVTSFSPDPDGFASYGRVGWYGYDGLLPYTLSRSDTTRVQQYSCDVFENIGFNPADRAVRLSKPHFPG
eukprot:11688501-Heterocapsa_arctica.AAC.1